MERIATFFRRLAFALRARRHAADLAAEVELHRARIQAGLEADGIPPAEAAARSRRTMGNITLAREDARDVWAFTAIERTWRDAVYGTRALIGEPAFALTALITLTLGIATTTTVFSVVDAELWRPLPFPEPRQLVAVYSRPPGAGSNTESVTGPDYLDWRAASRLADYAAEGGYGRRVLRRNHVLSVSVQPVTANYFEVLRFAPTIGRAFHQQEDEHANVALVTDLGWRRRFDSDPSILGASLNLDGVDYTIVGIAAGQHFEFGTEPDLFLSLDPTAGLLRDRNARALSVIGRVRQDATVAQALSELEAITARIAVAFPQDREGHRVEMEDLRLAYSTYNWRPLVFFLGAAVLVLLLSCLNVASLLLARALRRQREFAIRGALGGGRAALVRQLMVEGALLAVPSAAAGTLLSMWGLQLFSVNVPPDYLARGGQFSIDGRVLAFVVMLTAVTTFALSLAPLVFARRIELNLMLAQGGRTAGRTPQQMRARNGLLVAQLTMTLVLMVAAGLFVTSYIRLTQAPLGFDPQNRVAMLVVLSGPNYAGDGPVRAFGERLLERARAIPGVQAAALGSSSPLMSGNVIRMIAGDRPRPPAGEEPSAIVRAITPDYFRTLGIRQVAGRPFDATDVAGSPRVAIVNEYLASKLFPGENAIGRQIELVPGARTPWTRRPGNVTVVGVVSNVKDVGINEVEFGNIYWPFAQAPSPGIEVIVQSSLAVASIAESMRTLPAAVDAALPVSRLSSMSDRVRSVLQEDRFHLILIATFAIVAILLAAVGIYGAMACAVQERTREFGVRLALGEQPRTIVRKTVWQATRFGLTAGAIGLGLALLAAKLIGNGLYLVRGEHTGLLYGVTTTDPLALAGAVVGLTLVAALSGIVPARHATQIDPLIALRSE